MKNAKRFIAAILCLALVTSCACVNLFAAGITIGANDASCAAGEIVNVPVYISNNSGFTNLEIKVSFDSTLLEAVNVIGDGSVLSGALSEYDIGGNYVKCSTMATESITGSGNLFTIEFKAISSEAVVADLTVDVEIAGNVVEDITSQISAVNGSVTIGSGKISESTTKPTTTETSTETTTKAKVTTTETTTKAKVTTTETTTKARVTTTETTTKAKVTTTEATTKIEGSTELTTKSPVTETTTKRTTTTTEEEDDTETTTRGGNSSSKASVKSTTEKAVTEENTEATTKAAPTLTGSVSVVIGQSKISINGSEKSMDAAAYIQPSSNSTMVPLRFVADAVAGVKGYDATVNWDGNSKTATITYGDNTLSFKAGSSTMAVNGKTVVMENGVSAEIKDGRMYIPFRALGNALDVNVSWDAQSKTAVYTVK